MNGFEEISSEFVVGFIGRQIQLIEAILEQTIRIRKYYNYSMEVNYHVWAEGNRSVERSSR